MSDSLQIDATPGMIAGSALEPLTSDQMVTLGVIIAAVVLLAGYDVWVAARKGGDPTLSWVLTSMSMNTPIIGVAAGILIGHLFWPQKGVPDLTKD